MGESEENRIEDTKKADFIGKIVDEDLELALKMVERIEDREAKSFAYLHIFNTTRDEEFLNESVGNACKCENKDRMLLLIVESISRFDREKAKQIADLIEKEYYRNKAFATILEKCDDFELASRITCKRILSSSLKRLALKRRSVEIATAIPDPYYRALAMLGLAKVKDIDVKAIEEAVELVENEYLKKRLKRELNLIFGN